MLQKEAVAPEMITLIKELQNNSLFKDHFLAGGTALTLQLGHRTSTDIDLFTLKEQSFMAIIQYLNKNYKNVDVNIGKDDFSRIFVNGIKIELVEYNEKLLEIPEKEDGITLVGKKEIAAMKLAAILKRTEPRDFIDIAYLLNEMSLKNMFDLYKEKFGSISPLYIKRTLLTKSSNIKDNEWLVGGIKMLRSDIELKNIPSFIKQKIEEYNNNLFVVNNIDSSNI